MTRDVEDRTLTLPASLRTAGIHPITMPMPFALAHVHAYALETNDGWALIDAGFPSHAALAIFERELTRIVGDLARIRAVVVSHFHPDHSGLAGWVQQHHPRAGLAAARGDATSRRRGDRRGGGRGLLDEPLDDDPAGGEQVFDVFRRQMDDLQLPEPPPRWCAATRRSRWAGAPCACCGRPDTRPGISAWPTPPRTCCSAATTSWAASRPTSGCGSDGTSPLHEFEDSLRKVASMDFRTVLPAHEAVVERPAERIAEILAHHVERRGSAVAAIEAGETGLTGIAARVFAKRWGDPMQRAFATAETLAHLEALVVDGALAREGRGARASYRLS